MLKAVEGASLEKHHCAVEHMCRNCMPKRRDDTRHAGDDDDGDKREHFHCWGVPSPILYKVRVVSTLQHREPSAIAPFLSLSHTHTQTFFSLSLKPKLESHGMVGEEGNVSASVEQMMSEIYQRGPIVCAIACDERFDYGYNGGMIASHPPAPCPSASSPLHPPP